MSQKTRCVWGALVALLAAAYLPAAEPLAATLRRATQGLMDATAPGERPVWAHYTDKRFVYVTEDNEVKGRDQVLKDLRPLPPGYAGWITVESFECRDFGAFAVTTYVIDEHEIIEGQTLHARYRSSDTWRPTAAGWRLAAVQVFAIQQDPPRGTSSATRLADYEGQYRLGAATRQSIRRDGDHLLATARRARPPTAAAGERGCVLHSRPTAQPTHFHAHPRR